MTRSRSLAETRHRTAACLAFAGPRRPILVSGAGDLLPELSHYLPDWPYRTVEGASDRSADIRVVGTPCHIHIDEGNPARTSSDHASNADAAPALAGALMAAYVEQDEALLCLHAAAAEVGDGLVVMIGDTEAGKSSLAVELVRAGYRSFGDDRLIIKLADAVEGGHDLGIAVGLPLKLRLPLPPEAPDGLAAFVAARTAARTAYLVRLRLADAEAARFGETARLRALVLLERIPGAAERVEPAAASAILQALLSQGFAPRLATPARVAALAALARRVPGYRLAYSRSHLAAPMLATRLSRPATAAGTE